MGTVAANSVVCPRCGYDLRGQVDAWHPGFGARVEGTGTGHDAAGDVREADVGVKCPLEGTCSECGLRFEWKYLMRPSLLGPEWFVESPRPSRERWSAHRTLSRLVRPDRFWLDVRVEQPIFGARLLWFVLWAISLIPALGFVAISLQLLIASMIRGVFNAYSGPRSLGSSLDAAWQWFWQVTTGLFRYGISLHQLPSWVVAGGTIVVAFPFMLVLLPYSRKVSKIRLALVLRGMVYSLAWFAFMWVAACVVQPIAAYYHTMPWNPNDIASWKRRELIASIVPFPVLSGGWGASHVLWMVLVIGWILVYWWYALRDGLRMQQYKIIFTCCAVPALLLAGVILAFNPDNFLWSV